MSTDTAHLCDTRDIKRRLLLAIFKDWELSVDEFLDLSDRTKFTAGIGGLGSAAFDGVQDVARGALQQHGVEADQDQPVAAGDRGVGEVARD